MEVASEMVLRASQAKLPMVEIPAVLNPNERTRPTHLRSFRDGLQHVMLLLVIRMGTLLSISKLRILELCLLLLCFGAFAFALLPSETKKSSRIAPPTVLVKAVDASGDVVSGKIDVTNGLGFALEQLRISPSCTCAVTELPPGPLNANEKLTIPFHVNLTGRDADFSVMVALEYRFKDMWYGELIDIVILF